jgi:hypothetical protein
MQESRNVEKPMTKNVVLIVSTVHGPIGCVVGRRDTDEMIELKSKVADAVREEERHTRD